MRITTAILARQKLSRADPPSSVPPFSALPIPRRYRTSQRTPVRTSRGIAVNAAGMVVTALPRVLSVPEAADAGIFFHADFPEEADKIIFLTGGAFTPLAREFLDLVPNPRVEKPFEIQNLRAIVNSRVH